MTITGRWTVAALVSALAAGTGVVAQTAKTPAKANEPRRSAAAAVDGNHSSVDADGTTRITRVIPVPKTVSDEAQKVLRRAVSDVDVPATIEQQRAGTDSWQARAGELSRKLYPVRDVSTDTIAGVPVRIITPLEISSANRDRVLLNVHGGGFKVDSGSLTESIPMANLTGTKVIAVLYRLAPEHPFPAAVDDAVAVYKDLLKTYAPQHIVLYGTSAGAILTGQVAVRLKSLRLPLPAALGIFSGFGDFSRHGDSEAMYGLNGLAGYLANPSTEPALDDYVRGTDPRDPLLSPIYADLKGMPPALFITSERDELLSGTVNLHRAFLKAGADARLVVFDALPHAFWNMPELPESKEADATMAAFFKEQLGK